MFGAQLQNISFSECLQ